MKKVLFPLLALGLLSGPAMATQSITQEQLKAIVEVSHHAETDWPRLLRRSHRYLDANVVQFLADRSTYAFTVAFTDTPQARPLHDRANHDAFFFALLADDTARELHQPLVYRLQLADDYWRKGDGAQAFDILENITISDPNMAQPYVVGGDYMLQIGNYEDARTKFNKALRIDRDSEECLQHLAEIDVLEKRWPDAQKAVDRLLSAHPTNAKGQSLKPAISAALQANASPVPLPATGYQADPEAQKLYLEGKSKTFEGQLTEAENDLRQAVQKDPKYVDAWTQLGYILVRQSNWIEAAKAYEQAVSLDQSNAENWHAVGMANEQAFDETHDTSYLTRCLQGYQTAIRLSPQSTQYQLDLDRASKKQ